MSKGRRPGFTAESALARPATRDYSGRARDPGVRAGLVPAVDCSPGTPGSMSVEEYQGMYYVCCCPDDFRKPCDCTGIV